MNQGFSMLMVGPDERRIVRALMGSISRSVYPIRKFSPV
jgi:ATP-dependent RNA helicase DDX24/MAK5